MRRVIGGLGAVLVVAAAVLVLTAAPAAACSCIGGIQPAYEFTATAVEDLGYEPATSRGLDAATALGGEVRVWRVEVTDARKGLGDGEIVEISMAPGFRDLGNGSFMTGGCGMDDNLIVGEAYVVATTTLEGMNTCASRLLGTTVSSESLRQEAMAREQGERRRPWSLVAAGAAATLAVGSALVVRRHRGGSREELHKGG